MQLKTVRIRDKEYVEVNERIKAFRSLPEFKGYSLESEIYSLENGVITIKATIKDADGVIKATGLAQEKESSSFINKTSFVENCETSAWGRALGNLGIGIDTSVASAEEVQNAILNQKTKNPTINNDLEIFNGLRTCSDLNTLKTYYEKNYKKVADKKGFAKLKDEIKEQLYV